MFEDAIMQDIDSGKEVKLSDYIGKGKYVLAEFWASWCTPCIKEIPYLKKINQKYKDKNFMMLGINVSDNREKALNIIENYKIDWKCLYDLQGNSSIAKYVLNEKGIPFTILFAPDGTILNIEQFKGEQMIQYIDGVMNEL